MKTPHGCRICRIHGEFCVHGKCLNGQDLWLQNGFRYSHAFTLQLSDAGFFRFSFMEAEADKPAFVLAIVFEILAQLFYAFLLIGISTIDFQFYNILFSKIIHYNICPCQIPGSCLYIIISDAVYNGL